MLGRRIFYLLSLVGSLFANSRGHAQDYSSAWNLIAGGAKLIDVRTPAEFASGHLETAINIDYEDILLDLEKVGTDRAQPVVLYCASGYRSGKALKALAAKGYSNLFNAGGYDELIAAKPLMRK